MSCSDTFEDDVTGRECLLRDFETELKIGQAKIKLNVPITIPYDILKVSELTHRILNSFDLPIVLETEIREQLEKFIEDENLSFNLEQVKLDLSKKQERLKQWEKLYVEETLEFCCPEVVSDDEVFSEAYHALVHSSLLLTLLRKESALNSTIREQLRTKQQELQQLRAKHSLELATAIQQASQNGSTADTSALQRLHADEEHMVVTRWESLIDNEKCEQKREYRDWVMKNYQEYFLQADSQVINDKRLMKKKLSVRFDDSLMISYQDEDVDGLGGEGEETLQESFTIHLGSQMKQMYNIRLLSCHPTHFLKFKNESSREISPQRLQMAISLYSQDLSGVVILTDSSPSVYNDGIERDLYELSGQTTDFHFDPLDKQLEFARRQGVDLKPGDFLVTKHSNLNSAHILFHLICNQSSLNRLENLNSRHPVILGLRNILKTACLNDITTITLPALLTHSMAEGMSSSWCARRAELVYKCVKGFMIEMASWGGADMKNLQFLVPQDIPEEVFQSLAQMLPNIFRVSNPLRLSSSSSTHSLQHQHSH